MFKSILEKLGVGPKKPIVRAKPKAATIKSNGNSKKRIANRKADRESLTINRKERLPKFERILSYSNGDIAISDELQKDYAILLLNEEKKLVNIISSVESSHDGGTDNNFLTIKERCRSQGYSIKHNFTSKQLIQILYESDTNSSLEEDKKRKEGYIVDFDRLVSEALDQGISDIHIEVRKNWAQVRFRRHGDMILAKEWTVNYARDMAVVVYQVLADEKEISFIESQQQAARIERTVNNIDLGIRLNTLPVSGGFDVVMRLLKLDADSKEDVKIPELGYSEKHVNDIEYGLSKPVGVIIIAGTTGSGKSTSLSTMLNGKIQENWGPDGPTIKVITVEDPTEYAIVGASQHGVVRKRGSTENPFAESIKAAMRCDPDILMVGEVRDTHSAQLLMGAVQSGHTALTTVHAGSGIGIVPRLRSMGIPNDVLGSNDFISALIYQTLIPLTCKCCAKSLVEFQSEAERTKDKKALALLKRLADQANELQKDMSDLIFRNDKGCDECNAGIIGRTVVAEVILPSPLIKSAFEQGKDNLALYHHLNSGGRLIIDHGIEKLFEGIADPADVEKKLGPLDSKIKLSELAESLGLNTNKNAKAIQKPNLSKVQTKQNPLIELESELLSNSPRKENKDNIQHVDFGLSDDIPDDSSGE